MRGDARLPFAAPGIILVISQHPRPPIGAEAV